MKFNTTSVWAAFLVVLSLSVVNAIPVDQAEAAAAVLSADELLTRGDGTFAIPEDAKVEEVPEASKKVTGCGFRSFFTYHSCFVWKSVTAATSNVRAVKVSIINEALEDDGTFDINGTFEQDFGIVHENLAEKQPSYFLVRLGDGNSSEWIFLCYVPDVAPIRQKMIYAATRASLTRDLGDSHFKDSIYGTNKSDFTLEGYKRHRASLAAPKPLTERERQLAEIHANEKTMVENMKGGAYRKSHAPGMSFPLTDDALAALRKLVITAQPAKPTVVASALPKTFTSPASTPLPASPVITRENTATSSDDVKKVPEANVDEDEWDDDSSKEVKDDSKPAEETKEDSIEAKKEEEVIAPVTEQPESVIKKERSINFVKLLIDAENERIDLASEDKIPVSALTKNIDEDSPRFTFYAYEHEHKGAAEDSLVFMYTCPTKSKIRERMLYSSCRAGVLTAAKDNAGLNVDKKLETTDVSDLTEAYILDELHPKAHSAFGSTTGVNSPRGFSKPTRPGARRVM
ncbi:Twinfilin-1 [Mortierella alpina]|nr:Twinfilin-1 [Mortierella alpina]